MKQLKLLGLLGTLSALAIGAGLAYAALGDTQSASGSVNVSTTSADLYICEPGNAAGPACGSDDNDGNEAIFESLEDLRPGQTAQWDVRLKNVGTVPFMVTGVTLTTAENNDPGSDCPEGSLTSSGPSDSYYNYPYGISLLGKNGDPANDNPYNNNDIPAFSGETDYQGYGILIAPGDYEDVRLRLRLQLQNTANCDGNAWNVAWNFTVN